MVRLVNRNRIVAKTCAIVAAQDHGSVIFAVWWNDFDIEVGIGLGQFGA